MPYLVLQVQPRFLMNDPFQYLFQRSFISHQTNQFHVFETQARAENYIRKQQIMAMQREFLMMAFEHILAEALIAQQRQQFFSSLQSVHYYSPVATQRPRPVQFNANRSQFSDDDNDFFRAQTASMQQAHQRVTPRPVPTTQMRNIDVEAALPKNFKLNEENTKSIKDKSFSCPISMNNFDECSELALVPIGNNLYNVYERKSIEDHFKANSKNGKTFTDPLTRAEVNFSDVLRIKPDLLHNFVNKPTNAVTTPVPVSNDEAKPVMSAGRRK